MNVGEPTTLLKRDRLGRVTIPRAQREALLDEFERSGLKGQPFASLVGVNYQTFASWIQKRRRARGDYAAMAVASNAAAAAKRAPRALRLIEAVAAASRAEVSTTAQDASAALEVFLPGGARLLVSHSSQLTLAAQLINSLRTSC